MNPLLCPLEIYQLQGNAPIFWDIAGVIGVLGVKFQDFIFLIQVAVIAWLQLEGGTSAKELIVVLLKVKQIIRGLFASIKIFYHLKKGSTKGWSEKIILEK